MNLELPVAYPEGTDSEMLDSLLRERFDFFRHEVDPQNGLVADKTQPGSSSSLAAVGLCLSVCIVAVERGLLSRSEAINRTLALLRFLKVSHQGPEPDATGNKGFYYHFIDIQTGRRVLRCGPITVA